MWLVVWLALASAPCDRCVLDLPRTDDPAPLLVVLHGDRGHAADVAARWLPATRKRGWALLAIECPKRLGCTDSFWKWNGDPAWVLAQVDAVAKMHAVDRARVFVAGWSGGATYLGMHAQAWSKTFAAIVIHGGGQAPLEDGCVTTPVYFLVGDKNPLHGLARELRDYFTACHAELTWDLVRGADHGHEEAALTPKKAGAILDWLDARAVRVAKP